MSGIIDTARRLPSKLLRLLPQSSSTQTLVQSTANKEGLSRMLDQTLKEGAHDMVTFGLGFFKSVASKEEYIHFTSQAFHFYREMENHLDENAGRVGENLWSQFPHLRRAAKLRSDLMFISNGTDNIRPPSPATTSYCNDIAKAARHENGERMLAHIYVRYFADLFGGRALGYPTRLALGLPPNNPHFYQWDRTVEEDRRAYIEQIYLALNKAGREMTERQREGVVEEARAAFYHNSCIYKERPGLISGAVQGAFNVASGFVLQRGQRRPYCC